MMITERIAAKETREDTNKKLLFYGAGAHSLLCCKMGRSGLTGCASAIY